MSENGSLPFREIGSEIASNEETENRRGRQVARAAPTRTRYATLAEGAPLRLIDRIEKTAAMKRARKHDDLDDGTNNSVHSICQSISRRDRQSRDVIPLPRRSS